MKTLKSDFSAIIRGLREIHDLCKGLLLLIVVQAAFDAVSPFINIYMSSLILNAIVYNKPFHDLMVYAVIAVAANLTVKFISRILVRILGLKRLNFNYNFELKLSQKISIYIPIIEMLKRISEY